MIEGDCVFTWNDDEYLIIMVNKKIGVKVWENWRYNGQLYEMKSIVLRADSKNAGLGVKYSNGFYQMESQHPISKKSLNRFIYFVTLRRSEGGNEVVLVEEDEDDTIDQFISMVDSVKGLGQSMMDEEVEIESNPLLQGNINMIASHHILQSSFNPFVVLYSSSINNIKRVLESHHTELHGVKSENLHGEYEKNHFTLFFNLLHFTSLISLPLPSNKVRNDLIFSLEKSEESLSRIFNTLNGAILNGEVVIPKFKRSYSSQSSKEETEEQKLKRVDERIQDNEKRINHLLRIGDPRVMNYFKENKLASPNLQTVLDDLDAEELNFEDYLKNESSIRGNRKGGIVQVKDEDIVEVVKKLPRFKAMGNDGVSYELLSTLIEDPNLQPMIISYFRSLISPTDVYPMDLVYSSKVISLKKDEGKFRHLNIISACGRVTSKIVLFALKNYLKENEDTLGGKLKEVSNMIFGFEDNIDYVIFKTLLFQHFDLEKKETDSEEKSGDDSNNEDMKMKESFEDEIFPLSQPSPTFQKRFTFLVDVGRAFDSIPINLVVESLKYYQLWDLFPNFFHFYLHHTRIGYVPDSNDPSRNVGIKFGRGLAQGDPLSPFLFNLCLKYVLKDVNVDVDEVELLTFVDNIIVNSMNYHAGVQAVFNIQEALMLGCLSLKPKIEVICLNDDGLEDLNQTISKEDHEYFYPQKEYIPHLHKRGFPTSSNPFKVVKMEDPSIFNLPVSEEAIKKEEEKVLNEMKVFSRHIIKFFTNYQRKEKPIVSFMKLLNKLSHFGLFFATRCSVSSDFLNKHLEIVMDTFQAVISLPIDGQTYDHKWVSRKDILHWEPELWKEKMESKDEFSDHYKTKSLQNLDVSVPSSSQKDLILRELLSCPISSILFEDLSHLVFDEDGNEVSGDSNPQPSMKEMEEEEEEGNDDISGSPLLSPNSQYSQMEEEEEESIHPKKLTKWEMINTFFG